MAPGAGAASVVMVQTCEVRGNAPTIKHLPLPARKCAPAKARAESACRRGASTLLPAQLRRANNVSQASVRLGNQSFSLRARESRQRNGKLDIQAKATFRARPDADDRGHRGVGWDLWATLGSDEFHCADEAGGIAGSEELLGVIAGSAGSTEFLGGSQLDVERSIQRASLAVAASGRLGAGFVKHVYGHCRLLSFFGSRKVYCVKLYCAQYKL